MRVQQSSRFFDPGFFNHFGGGDDLLGFVAERPQRRAALARQKPSALHCTIDFPAGYAL
jgi:hypothetical protein